MSTTSTTNGESPSAQHITFPPRVSPGTLAPDSYKAMVRLDGSITLDSRLADLLRLRASQINGCAYCLDMHAADLVKAGEDPRRLATLAGWRESPFFTPRERAALALTDAMTRIADAGVPDDVYDAAAAEFDEAELAQVIWAVTIINAWNRIAITAHTVPES